MGDWRIFGMKRSARLMGLIVVSILLGGCETPQFQTLKILDGPNRVVALQVMPDAYGGKGYDHPVTMTKEEMIRILQGVRVERGLISASQHAAFSDTEIQLFAPQFCQSLRKGHEGRNRHFFRNGPH